MHNLIDVGDFMTGEAVECADQDVADAEVIALDATIQQFEHYIKLNKKLHQKLWCQLTKLKIRRKSLIQ